MYYFYVLQNKETDRFYTGSTNNLNRRLKEHRSGKTRTSKVLGTYSLVYYEEFLTADEARDREKKIKSYKSKKYLKWLIASKNSKI